jgi:hypothetical protein
LFVDEYKTTLSGEYFLTESSRLNVPRTFVSKLGRGLSIEVVIATPIKIIHNKQFFMTL